MNHKKSFFLHVKSLSVDMYMCTCVCDCIRLFEAPQLPLLQFFFHSTLNPYEFCLADFSKRKLENFIKITITKWCANFSIYRSNTNEFTYLKQSFLSFPLFIMGVFDHHFSCCHHSIGLDRIPLILRNIFSLSLSKIRKRKPSQTQIWASSRED